MFLAVAQLIFGLFLLFLGGEYLVRGATRIALLARVSTAVVALTVVAMGTSLPELAVSIGAAARGVTDLLRVERREQEEGGEHVQGELLHGESFAESAPRMRSRPSSRK